jgi:hypothetical protein
MTAENSSHGKGKTLGLEQKTKKTQRQRQNILTFLGAGNKSRGTQKQKNCLLGKDLLAQKRA